MAKNAIKNTILDFENTASNELETLLDTAAGVGRAVVVGVGVMPPVLVAVGVPVGAAVAAAEGHVFFGGTVLVCIKYC